VGSRRAEERGGEGTADRRYSKAVPPIARNLRRRSSRRRSPSSASSGRRISSSASPSAPIALLRQPVGAAQRPPARPRSMTPRRSSFRRGQPQRFGGLRRRAGRRATGSRRNPRARSPNRSHARASARCWQRPAPIGAAGTAFRRSPRTRPAPGYRDRSRSPARSPRSGRAPRHRCRDRRRRLSTKVKTGRPKRSAKPHQPPRLAVAFGARAMPKLCFTRLSVSAPFLGAEDQNAAAAKIAPMAHR